MPSLLHSRASLAIEKMDYDIAIAYLRAAIDYTIDIKKNPDLPQQDLISESLSYNQLAIAYGHKKLYKLSIQAYNDGLVYSPYNCDLLANLGNQYKVKNIKL